jgi:hypothetical protein
MADPVPIKTIHLKYKGMTDIKECYKLMMDWFESKGFEYHESVVKHKVAISGEENELTIEAWRNVTDYYRFNLRVFIHYWDGIPVEVVKGTAKKTLIKARYYFRISGNVELDYSGRFSKNSFRKALGTFLNKKVLSWQWESIYWDQLFYKAHELANVVKEYLNMEASGSEFADMW